MKKFYNAGATDGAGAPDATAVVLKAIDGMKANMVTKENVETIAGDKIKAAVEPINEKMKEVSDTVKALNEKAGQLAAPVAKKSVVAQMAEGIKENLSGETLKKFAVGDTKSVDLALKTAGTMTVADDLTAGSPVTTYSLRLEQIPGRLVNFRNLVSTTAISTGIFEFPREVAKEGSIADQTPGAKKSLINARFEMITVTTAYKAGLAPVAKQMMQDLPFVQGFMPTFLLREYLFQEDSDFYTVLAAAATGSTTITGAPTSDIEQIMGYVANLRKANYQPNGIVMNPADVYKIFINKAASSGEYTLPPGVVLSNSGAISIFGIPVFETTFIPEDKVLVGDWTKATIVQTDGLSVQTDDRGDNFDNNTVTWKVEARVNLAVLQPAAFVYADLGNVTP